MAAHDRGDDLEAFFGPLEARVLEAMWTLQSPAAVRDLQPLPIPTVWPAPTTR